MFCEKGRSYQDQAQCQTQRFKDSPDASLIQGAQSNEGKETKCVDTKYMQMLLQRCVQGAMEAKRKPVNPARWRKKTSGKKLINQPVNQPFPAASTRMRGAACTEEEETTQGRSSPAADLKGIWKFTQEGLSGRRVVSARGRQSKESSSSPWREQGQAAGPVRGYCNSPSQE